MKILYVSAIELDTDGGPKTHIIEMLKEWHNLGHDILLLTPPYNRKHLKLRSKVVVYPFFGYSFFRRIISYLFMFVFLIRCICKFKPTVVYQRQMEYNPSVWLVCRIFKLPFFVEINGLMTEDLEQTGSGVILTMIHKVVEKKEFYSSTGMLCTSPLLKEKMCERYNNVSDKICFIPNGVNLNLFRPMNKGECWIKMGFRPEMKYIGYVGTFNYLDNSEQIIESFIKVAQKIPEAQLVIVGDGPRRKNCQKIVTDFNLTERVIFTGLITYEEVPLYINCFHIGIVFASKLKLQREGVIAFKLQEFLACGCPTIAHYENPRDYDQFCPFIKMVYIEDKLALSDAIIELLQDPDKCSSMAKRALSYIKENISWEKSAVKTINFIKRKKRQYRFFYERSNSNLSRNEGW